MRLTATARETLRDAGITATEWARRWWVSGGWGGDACGCPDDRCIGHHHDAEDECGCLPALLAEAGQ